MTSANYNLTELRVSRLVAQICEAMRFIHSKSVVHLDLKVKSFQQSYS